jgi:hypothetical protein
VAFSVSLYEQFQYTVLTANQMLMPSLPPQKSPAGE